MTKREMIDAIYAQADGYKGMSELAYALLERLSEEDLQLLCPEPEDDDNA